MKKKISFLVEKDFAAVHVGIRNYIFSIYSLLSESFDVDIITISNFNNNHFFARIKIDQSYIDNNGFAANTYINVERKKDFDIRKVWSEFHKEKDSKISNNFYYQSMGEDIDEMYDVVIITNPWMIDFANKIKCGTLIGMVHDTIPNEYALQLNVDIRDSALIKFANLHRNGFNYYNKYCDFVIFSSQKSLDGYNKMYGNSFLGNRKVTPPIVCKEFYDHNLKSHEAGSREYMMLATPFEKRKGIDYIPNIVNKTKNIKKLFIFGDNNRCSLEETNSFFNRLRSDLEIIWYKNITTTSLIALMKRSKLMLFASRDEGLGLPIIEAQLCGCKVLCYDNAPMNLNIVKDMKYYLSENNVESAAIIDKIYAEEDGSFKVIESANAMFSRKNISEFFTKIINAN